MPCFLLYPLLKKLVFVGITEWDPWGVPDDYECEVIENDAPVPKHVPLHRPGPLPEEFYKTLESITSTSKRGEPKITPMSQSEEQSAAGT